MWTVGGVQAAHERGMAPWHSCSCMCKLSGGPLPGRTRRNEQQVTTVI